MGNSRSTARDNRDNGENERGVKRCVTVKNHAAVRKDSIKFVPSNDGSNLHELEMMFDANYECMVTLYLFAQEFRNSTSPPLFYYTDTKKYGAPKTFKFAPGLKQKFPKGICQLDLSQYEMYDLTHMKEDYFPIVIGIESIFPSNYRGRAKKSV